MLSNEVVLERKREVSRVRKIKLQYMRQREASWSGRAGGIDVGRKKRLPPLDAVSASQVS
jgi:hypothetical protein